MKIHFLPHLLVLLAAVLCWSDCSAQTIGRLFLSPAQREEIDKRRNEKPQEEDNQNQSQSSQTAPETFPLDQNFSIEVKGIITRSNGKSVVWIDDSSNTNTPIDSNGMIIGHPSTSKESVAVKLPDGQSLKLKPGQIYQSESNTIAETYQTREPLRASKASPSQSDETSSENSNNKTASQVPEQVNQSLESMPEALESLQTILNARKQLNQILEQDQQRVEP